MKRIISISMCVAMLLSMLSMTVGAYGSYTDQITTENVMKITTDKDSYNPGDTIVISASMESIWGDPDIVDNIEGFDYELPGAYGMNIIQATVIYDPSVFSAKAYTNLFADTRKGIYSTILNSEALGVTVTGNNFLDANRNGAQNVTITSATHNLEDSAMIEPMYCFFNGSGDLWKWNLTIAEDAAPGTYYLPVGPYRYTSTDMGDGYQPDIAFLDDGVNDRVFGYNGNVDSLFIDRKVTYDTGYTGPSRVDADHPELRQVFDPCEIEASYIEIVIEANGEITSPTTPPVVEDPMSFELTVDNTGYVKDDIVNATFSVKNNEGLNDAAGSTISFDNSELKLIEIASPIEGAGDAQINLDFVNKLGSFTSLGTPVSSDVFFNPVAFDDDGTVLTAKFQVLGTAEDGDSVITVTNIESGIHATANAVINANGHKHDFKNVIVDPTCDKKGTENETCSCGLDFLINTTSANGHVTSETSKVVTTPAKCGQTGVTVTYCDVCGNAAINKTLEALEHDLKDFKTELSCTTDETSWQECQREGCGYKTEVIKTADKLNHIKDGALQWGEDYISKKPTTRETGMWSRDCQLCGAEWGFDEIPVLAIHYGDVNMDGKINISDVTTLLKFIAKYDNLYFSHENADVYIEVDTNGKQMFRINVGDVTRIIKYIAKWDIQLGVLATRA